MARTISYKCPHCHTRAKILYTKALGPGATKVTCICSDEECKAMFALMVTHLEDIHPPMKKCDSNQLGYFEAD